MKKRLALILAAILTAAMLTGCGGGSTPASSPETPTDETNAAEESFTIKLPYDYAEGHFESDLLMNFFAPEVEARSNGTLKIECYPGGILGTQEQIYEGVRNGMYEMAIIGVIAQDLMPQVAAFQFPFLFSDFATAKQVLIDEGYGWKLLENSEDHGFKVLSLNPVGFRVMTLNKKIESIDGFRGFVMRTPTIANMVQIFEDLGCVATPMAMTEVYSGLEQGVIDGQENPPATIRSSGWYEVQDYLLVSNHVFNPDWLAVNLDFWNRLSDNQKTILTEVAGEFQDKMWEAAENADRDDLQFMMDNSDIEVYEPSDEFLQEMIEATSGMYDTFYENMPEYKDVVEEMRAFSR